MPGNKSPVKCASPYRTNPSRCLGTEIIVACQWRESKVFQTCYFLSSPTHWRRPGQRGQQHNTRRLARSPRTGSNRDPGKVDGTTIRIYIYITGLSYSVIGPDAPRRGHIFSSQTSFTSACERYMTATFNPDFKKSLGDPQKHCGNKKGPDLSLPRRQIPCFKQHRGRRKISLS